MDAEIERAAEAHGYDGTLDEDEVFDDGAGENGRDGGEAAPEQGDADNVGVVRVNGKWYDDVYEGHGWSNCFSILKDHPYRSKLLYALNDFEAQCHTP